MGRPLVDQQLAVTGKRLVHCAKNGQVTSPARHPCRWSSEEIQLRASQSTPNRLMATILQRIAIACLIKEMPVAGPTQLVGRHLLDRASQQLDGLHYQFGGKQIVVYRLLGHHRIA